MPQRISGRLRVMGTRFSQSPSVSSQNTSPNSKRQFHFSHVRFKELQRSKRQNAPSSVLSAQKFISTLKRLGDLSKVAFGSTLKHHPQTPPRHCSAGVKLWGCQACHSSALLLSHWSLGNRSTFFRHWVGWVFERFLCPFPRWRPRPCLECRVKLWFCHYSRWLPPSR